MNRIAMRNIEREGDRNNEGYMRVKERDREKVIIRDGKKEEREKE